MSPHTVVVLVSHKHSSDWSGQSMTPSQTDVVGIIKPEDKHWKQMSCLSRYDLSRFIDFSAGIFFPEYLSKKCR